MRGFPSGTVGLAAILATAVAWPTTASAEGETRSGTPANICQELVAFVHPPAPAAPAAPSGQGASAVQAPAANPSGSNAAPPKAADAGDTQKNSGLSGPVSQSGPGAAGPQGKSQNGAEPSGAAAAPKSASAAAPTPPAPPAPKKPTAGSIDEADAAARDNDIAGCQRVARQMRRTGVVMPQPLMALAALDLRFLEAAK